MITTHIDDIKGSATEEECEILLAALRRDYGNDAKIEKTAFEHTGIQHVQDENKSTVYTHQNHYIKDLSEIPTSHLDMKDLDKEVDADTHALYWSLLGGIAWLLQTRADICPFVGFLQRAAQKPLIRHVRLINRVLRYVRRVPSGILFQKLEHPVRLVVVADDAYKAKAEAQECLALRGYIILLVGSNKTTSQYPGGTCNVLDYVSKKFQQVTRSSFAAELRNQVEAAQVGAFFSAFMEENLVHRLSALKLSEVSDKGDFHLRAIILGDNDGVFRAVTAENPRTPTASTQHARPSLQRHARHESDSGHRVD